MALTVVLRASGEGPKRDPIALTFDAPRVVVGRGEGCEVRLPDPSVSHRHASIRQRGADYILLDEGSTNGTFMGGVKLAPQSPRVLRSGDRFRVGRVWLEARIELPLTPPSTAAHSERMALELVCRALEDQGERPRPLVTVAEGPDAGRTVELADPARKYVIGRGKEADLLLDTERASRRHVEVGMRGKEVIVRDLGAQEPAMLGEVPLRETPSIWRPGVVLVIEDDRLTLLHAGAAALAELERGPDEPLRSDELDDEPDDDEEPEADASADPSEPHVAAPIETPAPRSATTSTKDDAAWNVTDGAVVLAALGVLAVSVAGLIWLLR